MQLVFFLLLHWEESLKQLNKAIVFQPRERPEVISEYSLGDRDTTILTYDNLQQELNASSSMNDSSSEESQEDVELQSKKYKMEDFNLLSVLGKGTFSKVILTELKGTDEVYALKIMKKDMIVVWDMIENTHTERHILALARKHPYLTQLFCCFQTINYLCFAMEFEHGGDLSYQITNSFRFSESCSQFYTAEITSAVMFLHSNGIIHRDLKPKNILLDADGHCKVADFGLSKEAIFDGKTTNTICGTLHYMAPEIIHGWEYGMSVDWWALGIIMYEMMIGVKPFNSENNKSTCEAILYHKVYYPQWLSREVVSILKAFLRKSPKARLGCIESQGKEEAIKVHPFFKTIDWALLEERKVTPPLKPAIRRNTNEDFLSEEPKLSPVNLTITQAFQDEFKGFSYINTSY